MGRLSRLAIVAAAATFLLIVLGGMARLAGVGAGEGCGADWPLCRGALVPPLEFAPVVDYLHRNAAASVGLLVLAVSVVAKSDARAGGRTRRLAWSSAALIAGQLLVDAVAVRTTWPVWAGTVHLGAALGVFALTLATAWSAMLDRGALGWASAGVTDGTAWRRPGLSRASYVAALATLAVILSGVPMGTAAGAVACTSWPLCLDLGQAAVATGGGARLAVLALAVLVVVVGAFAWREQRTPTKAAAVLVVGFALVQVGLSAADPGLTWSGPLTLANLTLLWATLIAVGALAGGAAGQGRLAFGGDASLTTSVWPRVDDAPLVKVVAVAVASAQQSVRDYVALTKPGILTLLLTTTLCAMLTAAAGIPPFGLVVATLLGGALAAGGANALNCFLDRDIDAVMPRTRHRATVAGRIGPAAALWFGLILSVAAVAVLGIFVNWLTAGLALAGNAYYVMVYTWWLKRRTPQNIVIGGAAGAVPPLVGWAAVTGELAPIAWGLFAIIFFWTPPHFWALALLKQGEYGRAAVPMLPNVAGERATRLQIVLYSVALAAVCLFLIPLGLGPVYTVGALVFNGVFVWLALRLWHDPTKARARRLFFWSLWYLALVFSVAVFDRLVIG